MIWMFHHLATLLSLFCQIPISPTRIGKTVEHLNYKSTQSQLRCMVR